MGILNLSPWTYTAKGSGNCTARKENGGPDAVAEGHHGVCLDLVGALWPLAATNWGRREQPG